MNNVMKLSTCVSTPIFWCFIFHFVLRKCSSKRFHQVRFVFIQVRSFLLWVDFSCTYFDNWSVHHFANSSGGRTCALGAQNRPRCLRNWKNNFHLLTRLLTRLLTNSISIANSTFPLLRLIALFSFTPSCFLAFLCAPLPARNLPGHIGSDTTAARPPRGGRRWCHCDAPLGGFG